MSDAKARKLLKHLQSSEDAKTPLSFVWKLEKTWSFYPNPPYTPHPRPKKFPMKNLGTSIFLKGKVSSLNQQFFQGEMFDFIGGVTRRLGWKESQEHGVSLRSSEIRINDPYKVGPKKKF